MTESRLHGLSLIYTMTSPLTPIILLPNLPADIKKSMYDKQGRCEAVRGYRVPRPGLRQGARAIVIGNANWFWLSRVLHWSRHLDPAIDKGIEISC